MGARGSTCSRHTISYTVWYAEDLRKHRGKAQRLISITANHSKNILGGSRGQTIHVAPVYAFDTLFRRHTPGKSHASHHLPLRLRAAPSRFRNVIRLIRIRQSIQCQADSTPLYTFGDFTVGDDQLHKCRSWEQLREFATAHTACYKDSVAPIVLGEHFGFCDDGSDGLP